VKLSADVGGRIRVVEVRHGRKGYQVTVDGKPVAVDVMRGERFWSLLVGGASYELSFGEETGGVTMVHVNGHAIPVIVSGGAHFGTAARRARGVPAGADGPQRLTAPMPGRVVKWLVRAGDRVEVRQGLVVIEAMKMENELRSPKAGTVTETRVPEGTTVEAGTTLAVVE
jgi:biotin carboxyl carrier protein